MTLKELRKLSKKTAAEVAAALGVTRTAITNYESGTRSLDIRYIIPLAELYEVSERDVIEAQLEAIGAKEK